LRLKNPEVVELLQDYFELKWQSATILACARKPANENII
jgi:hypothetical protein